MAAVGEVEFSAGFVGPRLHVARADLGEAEDLGEGEGSLVEGADEGFVLFAVRDGVAGKSEIAPAFWGGGDRRGSVPVDRFIG